VSITVKFRQFLSRLSQVNNSVANVLSMNQRNLHYIYPNNQRCDYPLADDKLETKKLLEKLGVPHPATYQSYRYFYQLRQLGSDLDAFDKFVIKPASGHGGNGIKVIVDKDSDGWYDANGKCNNLDAIRKHIYDIVFGVYSFDLHDTAIIEQLIIQHQSISHISPFGLADVRVITCRHEPVLAMLRVPTKASGGKSNLHQGAIGVGVRIDDGVSINAIMNGQLVSAHPDTGIGLVNVQIPGWREILEICQSVAREMPLKYLGFDIGLSERGPVILELNVRPGIEIQNANMLGMRKILEATRG